MSARCDVCQEEIDVKKLPKIELEGWLWLQSANSAKSWNKRYFVLYGKHVSIFARKDVVRDFFRYIHIFSKFIGESMTPLIAIVRCLRSTAVRRSTTMAR